MDISYLFLRGYLLLNAQRKFWMLTLLALTTVAGCSRGETGPEWAWVCENPADAEKTAEAARVAAAESAATTQSCNIQVQGETLLIRLVRKENRWDMLASHPDGGQVRTELTVTPRRGDPIVIQASSRTQQCGPRHCILLIPDETFNTLRKARKLTVDLTRASVVPHSIKHQTFTEELGTNGLRKAIKDAGL